MNNYFVRGKISTLNKENLKKDKKKVLKIKVSLSGLRLKNVLI